MTTQELEEKTKRLRMDLESKISFFINETGFIPEIEAAIIRTAITDKTGFKSYVNDVEVNIKVYVS